MTEPEIDRRCPSCGASVRKQAAFCPQCGQMLDKREQEKENVDHSEAMETVGADVDQTEADFVDAQPAELTTNDGNEESQSVAYDSSSIDATSTVTGPVIVRKDDGSDGSESTAVGESAVAVDNAREAYKTQPLFTSTTHSSATVASGVPEPIGKPSGNAQPRRKEGQVLARVDKIRKVSSVMIDQAAYDPSLRFLLVAGVLFLVFVVLMILSKVLG